jgi:O-antigen/teichoic acid export membrane protein
MNLAPRPGDAAGGAITRTVPALTNILAHYGGTFATAVVVLLLTPFLVRHLGATGFGVWSLTISLGEYLNLLGFGTRAAVIKFTSEHQARRDVSRVADVVRAAVAGRAVAGVIGFGLACLAAAFLLPALKIPPESLGAARTALIVIGAGVAINLPLGVSGSLLEGMHRYDLLNWLRIIHAVVRGGAIVVVLLGGGADGLIPVCVIEVSSMALLNVARFVAAGRIHPALVTPLLPSREALRGVYAFGLWGGLMDLAVAVVERASDLLLVAMVGASAVTAWNIGLRAGSIPVQIIVPLVVVFLPLAAEMNIKRSGAMLPDLLVSGSKAVLAVALPLGIILAIGARTVVEAWIGPDYDEAVPLLRLLALHSVLTALSLPAESLLMGTGRVRALAGILCLRGALGLTLGILWIQSWGTVGLAGASVVSAFVVILGLQIPVACRSVGIPLRRFAREAVIPVLLPALPLAVAAIAVRPVLAGSRSPAVIFVAVLLLGLYLLLMLLFGFTPSERLEYSRRLQLLRRRMLE